MPDAKVSSCVAKCFGSVRLDWVSPDVTPACSDFDGVSGEYPSECVGVIGSSSIRDQVNGLAGVEDVSELGD